jgi:DNA-directed RNA polymerase subunit L
MSDLSGAVDFVAYSVPHPSETIMNIRIQGKDPIKAYSDGLTRIIKMNDVFNEKFNKAFI